MNKIENTNSKNTHASVSDTRGNGVFNSSTLTSLTKNYCRKAALALALCIGTSYVAEAQQNPCSLPSFTRDVPAAYNLNVVNATWDDWTTFAAADMDGDGDIDLIVGDDGSALRYVQNTGSATAPFFPTSVNIVPVIGFETHPTIADIDGDGDFDVLYGRFFDDQFYYLQNIGNATTPIFAPSVINPFGLTAQNGSLAPEFVDLDGDGDFDLVVGNDGGDSNIGYFENIGTATAPNFAARVANPFGFDNIPGNNQYIKLSRLDFDGDGDIDFVYGNTTTDEMGFLINMGTTTAPNFIDLGSDLGLDENFGSDHTPVVLDIDGDGLFEALVGNGSAFADTESTYQSVNIAFDRPQVSILQGSSVTSCDPVTLEAVVINTSGIPASVSWLDVRGNVVGTGNTFTTPTPTENALLYKAVASVAACSSSPSNFTNVSCNLGQVVIDLSVTAGYNQAQLSWDVLGSRPVVEYEVYVSFDGGTPNILYGTTTSTTYLADALLNGVNTSFAVMAVYNNGSRSLASNTVTVRPSVVLGEDDLSAKGFAFFPNPNNGEFNIKLQDGSTSATVSVTSLSGQRVYTSTLGATQTSIALGNIASGMYIVRVETAQGIYQQKVSVIR